MISSNTGRLEEESSPSNDFHAFLPESIMNKMCQGYGSALEEEGNDAVIDKIVMHETP
jgi:hypothetical protein